MALEVGNEAQKEVISHIKVNGLKTLKQTKAFLPIYIGSRVNLCLIHVLKLCTRSKLGYFYFYLCKFSLKQRV